jgi:hypothetical protein
MITDISGKTLLRKLAACPSDAYPSGVTDSEIGNGILVEGVPVDADSVYRVSDNVRDREPAEVDTIDSDWSVWLA